MNSIRFNGIGQISQTIIFLFVKKKKGFGLPSTSVDPEQLQVMGKAKDEILTYVISSGLEQSTSGSI